jgi:large subunit ribosomal protein L18
MFAKWNGDMATAKSIKKKQERRKRVKRGIRGKITGSSQRPRLTVFRSNKHIYAQLIDDLAGHTLASSSSLEDGIDGDSPKDVSKAVGGRLAERAKEAGIERAVFDRNGYRYHGRVRALAEGAREGGLHV